MKLISIHQLEWGWLIFIYFKVLFLFLNFNKV